MSIIKLELPLMQPVSPRLSFIDAKTLSHLFVFTCLFILICGFYVLIAYANGLPIYIKVFTFSFSYWLIAKAPTVLISLLFKLYYTGETTVQSHFICPKMCYGSYKSVVYRRRQASAIQETYIWFHLVATKISIFR